MRSDQIWTDDVRLAGARYGPANRTLFTMYVARPLRITNEQERDDLMQLLEAAELPFSISDTRGHGDTGGREPGFRVDILADLASDPAVGNRLLEVAETLAIEWDQREILLISQPVNAMVVKA